MVGDWIGACMERLSTYDGACFHHATCDPREGASKNLAGLVTYRLRRSRLGNSFRSVNTLKEACKLKDFCNSASGGHFCKSGSTLGAPGWVRLHNKKDKGPEIPKMKFPQ